MTNVETKDIYLYFEVQDMTEDEQGNSYPAGIKVCVAKSVTTDSYDTVAAKFETIAALNEQALIQALRLDEIFSTDKIRCITKEEYEREYGE